MTSLGSDVDPQKIIEEQKPVWNRTADDYAEMFDGNVTQAVEPTLDAVGVRKGTRILDVASGPGILAAAAHVRGATVTGTDFAERMVEAARKRVPGIRFEMADAADLPFADQSFDAVTVGFALFLMGEPFKALHEAHRVLVPGGRLAVTVWDWPVPAFDLFYGAMNKYLPDEAAILENAPDSTPPLMGVSDHTSLKTALSEAGFFNPQVSKLPLIWELASAEHLFNALASLRDLSTLSSPELKAFQGEVVAGAQQYKKGDHFYIPYPALLLSGTRP